MSAEARIVRRHTCPACRKPWHCLAENPPHNKDRRPARPVVECAYPAVFVCAPCAREGAV